MAKITKVKYFTPETSINNVMLLTNDIELAKEHAGHKSTDTTLIYVKPKSKTEVREKLKQLREKKNKVMEETESESN
jgi:guanylate kinase